jgi:hypothetical protein
VSLHLRFCYCILVAFPPSLTAAFFLLTCFFLIGKSVLYTLFHYPSFVDYLLLLLLKPIRMGTNYVEEEEEVVMVKAFRSDPTAKIGLALKQRNLNWPAYRNNTDADDPIVISEIEPGSLFDSSDLRTGLKLLRINGRPCPKSMDDATKTIKGITGTLCIEATVDRFMIDQSCAPPPAAKVTPVEEVESRNIKGGPYEEKQHNKEKSRCATTTTSTTTQTRRIEQISTGTQAGGEVVLGVFESLEDAVEASIRGEFEATKSYFLERLTRGLTLQQGNCKGLLSGRVICYEDDLEDEDDQDDGKVENEELSSDEDEMDVCDEEQETAEPRESNNSNGMTQGRFIRDEQRRAILRHSATSIERFESKAELVQAILKANPQKVRRSVVEGLRCAMKGEHKTYLGSSYSYEDDICGETARRPDDPSSACAIFAHKIGEEVERGIFRVLNGELKTGMHYKYVFGKLVVSDGRATPERERDGDSIGASSLHVTPSSRKDVGHLPKKRTEAPLNEDDRKAKSRKSENAAKPPNGASTKNVQSTKNVEQICLATGNIVGVHPSGKAASNALGERFSYQMYDAIKKFHPYKGFLWRPYRRHRLDRPVKRIGKNPKYYPSPGAVLEELGLPQRSSGPGLRGVLNGRRNYFRGEVYRYVGSD